VNKLIAISDFNIDPLIRKISSPDLLVCETEFGQVIQTINKALIDDSVDTVLLWVRPESISALYNEALNFKGYSQDSVIEEFSFFLDKVELLAHSKKNIFLVNFSLPPFFRGLGAGDFKPGQGLAYLCSKLNMSVYERLGALSNILILDSNRWLANASCISNPKLAYAGKIVYSPEVYSLAGADVVSAIMAAEGLSRRIIVVDLDNTMWGGILGDVGVDGLNIGGHNFIGEAFVSFQKVLKSLKNRGILLAIASKNFEENALNAIESHPEMILRKDDFVCWQINWEDKAKNIIKIAQSVNLGLSSVVFIDDNPAERGRVQEVLPEVFVPDWPVDPTGYAKKLLSLTCFDSIGISDEDFKRSVMFAEQANREVVRKSVSSDDEWLASIGMELVIEKVNEKSLSRTAQLLNKTNQFNLRTRRLSETQLNDWLSFENNTLWTVRVKDKFGDSGLTGLFSISRDNGVANVEDFILSCRVMGRLIENVMLSKLIEYSLEFGCNSVCATLIKSDRNMPIISFLEKSKVLTQSGDYFSWAGVEAPLYPGFIAVK
jgi:FkbH-like protein